MGRALRFASPIDVNNIVQYQETPEGILHLFEGQLQVLPQYFFFEVLFLPGLGHTKIFTFVDSKYALEAFTFKPLSCNF